MTANTYRRALSTLLALSTMVFLGAGCGGGSSSGNSQTTPPTADAETAMPGEALIGVTPGMVGDAGVEAQIATVGTIINSNASGNFYLVQLNQGLTVEAANAQLTSNDIVYVEPNWQAHTEGTDTVGVDPYFLGSGTGYNGLGPQYSTIVTGEIQNAWLISGTVQGSVPVAGTPIQIAVLDTGVRCTHEDLANKCAAGEDVTSAPYAPLLATQNSDDSVDGHGTMVAGVAAAEINNSLGIAGIASAPSFLGLDSKLVTIVPVKVSSPTQVPTHASIAAGLLWVVNESSQTPGTYSPRAQIALISLGSGAPSWTLQNAIQKAYSAGVLVIAAAGNGSPNGSASMKYPAAYQSSHQNVVSVASANGSDAISTFSNFGTWVTVAAPGENIITTMNTGDSEYSDGTGCNSATPPVCTNAQVNGTSYSASFVAGAAALAWTKYPALTIDQLRAMIVRSVDSMNFGKTPIAANAGRLNVQALMHNAADILNPSVTGVFPTSVIFSSPTVVSGGTVTATVVLSGPVTGAANYTLPVTIGTVGTGATPAVTTLSIPVGSSSGSFKVVAASITGSVPSTPAVTATANGITASQTLTIQPPGIVSVTFSPNSVPGGTALSGVITFNTKPASAQSVTITTSNTSAIPNPPSAITIPAGSVTTKFTLPTSAVAANTVGITITAAQSGGPTVTTTASVTAPLVASLSLAPASTIVWDTPGTTGAVTGTVTLNVATAIDTPVTLTPSDSGITVPATVTVLKGATTGQFTVQPEPVVASTSFTVRATMGAYSPSNIGKTATFKVGPALVGFSVSPVSVSGAGSVLATATLAANAPTAQTIQVAVDPSICNTSTLPATSALVYFAGPSCSGQIAIASGQKSGTVQILTRAAAVPTVAPVVASLLGVGLSANITASAPTLSNITLAAKSVSVNNSIAGTVSLSGAAVATTTVALSIKSNTVSVIKVSSDNSNWGATATVTFNPGDSAKAFYVQGVAAGSDTVNAQVTGTTTVKTVAVSTVGAATLTVALTTPAPVSGVVTAAGGLVQVGGTVTLSPAAAADTVVTLATTSAVVSGTSVTVSKGATSAPFTLYVPPLGGSTATTLVGVSGTLPSGEHSNAAQTITVNPTITTVPPATAITLAVGGTATTTPAKVVLGGSNGSGSPITVGLSLVQANGTLCTAGTVAPATLTVATNASDTGAGTVTVTDTNTAPPQVCYVKASMSVGGVPLSAQSAAITMGPTAPAISTVLPGAAQALTVGGTATYGGIKVTLAAPNISGAAIPVTLSLVLASDGTTACTGGSVSPNLSVAMNANDTGTTTATVTDTNVGVAVVCKVKASIPVGSGTVTALSAGTITLNPAPPVISAVLPASAQALTVGGTATVPNIKVTLGASNVSGAVIPVTLSLVLATDGTTACSGGSVSPNLTVAMNASDTGATTAMVTDTNVGATVVCKVKASIPSAGSTVTALSSAITLNPAPPETIATVLPTTGQTLTVGGTAISDAISVTLGAPNLTGSVIPVTLSLVLASDPTTACAGGLLSTTSLSVVQNASDTGATTATVTDTNVGAAVDCKVKASIMVGGSPVTAFSAGTITLNPAPPETIAAVLPATGQTLTVGGTAISDAISVTLGAPNLTGSIIPVTLSLVLASDGTTACTGGSLSTTSLSVAQNASDTGSTTATVTDINAGLAQTCEVKASIMVGGSPVTALSAGTITLNPALPAISTVLPASPQALTVGAGPTYSGIKVTLAASNVTGADIPVTLSLVLASDGTTACTAGSVSPTSLSVASNASNTGDITTATVTDANTGVAAVDCKVMASIMVGGSPVTALSSPITLNPGTAPVLVQHADPLVTGSNTAVATVTFGAMTSGDILTLTPSGSGCTNLKVSLNGASFTANGGLDGGQDWTTGLTGNAWTYTSILGNETAIDIDILNTDAAATGTCVITPSLSGTVMQTGASVTFDLNSSAVVLTDNIAPLIPGANSIAATITFGAMNPGDVLTLTPYGSGCSNLTVSLDADSLNGLDGGQDWTTGLTSNAWTYTSTVGTETSIDIDIYNSNGAGGTPYCVISPSISSPNALGDSVFFTEN